MLHSKKEVHKRVTTVCQELHQQLVKELKELYTTMHDSRDVTFAGMQQSTKDPHKDINVS